MKYLKFFNEALESNEYYTQITWEDYKELSTIEYFTQHEVDTIKDYLNNNKSDSIDVQIEKEKTGEVREIYIKRYKNPIHYGSITIHKLEDDYFLLRDNPNSQGTANYFYKADQLEGLINLLKQVVLYNF
jgi:hypothetical protein